MISKKLSVGDYIFQADGTLARITRINKGTYSYDLLNTWGSGNIPFNGIKKASWGSEEWFECEDVQAKALELAFKRWETTEKVKDRLEELKKLIGKAKYFLNQVSEIEEIVVYENE